MSSLIEFVKDILDLTKETVLQMASSWDELSMTPVVQQRGQGDQETSNYSSEISVCFWDSTGLLEGRHDLIDVIEFHTVERGKPTGSMEEIELWLRATLADVCDRRRTQLKESEEKL